MMDTDHLVKMANQIGQFFEAMPDRAEGADGIAEHLRKFWDPRMRVALKARCEAAAAEGRDTGLTPIVLEALQRHPQLLNPAR